MTCSGDRKGRDIYQDQLDADTIVTQNMGDPADDELYKRTGTHRESVLLRIQCNSENTDKLYSEYPALLESKGRNDSPRNGNKGIYFQEEEKNCVVQEDCTVAVDPKSLYLSYPDQAQCDQQNQNDLINGLHVTCTNISGRITPFARRKALRAQLLRVHEHVVINFSK